jgi:tol-pal system protein YbgF
MRMTRPMSIGLLCGFLAALGVPAHAALFGDDEARRAILELRDKLTDLDQRNAAQVEDLGKRIDKLQGTLDASQHGSLETLGQMDALRQDLAKLRGQVEELTNDVATMQKRNRDLYTDLDQRLKKLEPTSVTVDGKTGQVDRDEQAAYDAALAPFRAGDFRTAINGLTAFLARYPQSVYAPAAQYWLGSSYYAIKDFHAAIAAQQTLVDRYPDSPRTPDALLNIAASQFELNDKKSARTTLNRIVSDFPDVEAAKLARDRLAALGSK